MHLPLFAQVHAPTPQDPSLSHIVLRVIDQRETMSYHELTQPYIRSLLSLLTQPATDEFFTHVRDDVSWTMTGKSFLSGHWTTKESYRTATFDRIGTLLRAPWIKLKITEGDAGIILGKNGRATADLHTFDTFTNDGTRYDQAYAWHMEFDECGMIAEVKV
ncbi:MAG: hypothetical protein Q9198_000469 [Flavoplaca austrocitrina]